MVRLYCLARDELCRNSQCAASQCYVKGYKLRSLRDANPSIPKNIPTKVVPSVGRLLRTVVALTSPQQSVMCARDCLLDPLFRCYSPLHIATSGLFSALFAHKYLLALPPFINQNQPIWLRGHPLVVPQPEDSSQVRSNVMLDCAVIATTRCLLALLDCPGSWISLRGV